MPDPTVRRSVNLPPDVDKELVEYAAAHSISITKALILAIHELVRRRDEALG